MYCVYYQVQVWLGNKLDPEEWGWKLTDNYLEPIQTLLPPAPEKPLHTIFCYCKADCSKNCCCQKVGLFCSTVCINCQGQTCSNIELNTTNEDIYDVDEETIDASPFLEQRKEILQEEENEDEEIIEEVDLDNYLS